MTERDADNQKHRSTPRRSLERQPLPLREEVLPPVRRAEKIECVAIDRLHGFEGHTRMHPKRQIDKIARSINAFGFVYPILAETDGTVISGHARLLAARKLNLNEVPVVWAEHLSPAQARVLRIAENRLAELAEWDRTALAIQFKELVELEVDPELTGFEVGEIDISIESQIAPVAACAADDCPPVDSASAVTQLGDMWLVGDHRVICGDARESGVCATLMRGMLAALVLPIRPTT